MNAKTTRTLGCGATVREISAYLSADRSPYNSKIETCPECRNAMRALERIATLSRDLAADDAQRLPPTNWFERVMTAIGEEVRSGRRVPLEHPDPRVQLSVSEGAIRSLVRRSGDSVDGIVVGSCRLDGEIETSGEPVDVVVSASVEWQRFIPGMAEELRAAVADALVRHTNLVVASIEVRIEDLHGYDVETTKETE